MTVARVLGGLVASAAVAGCAVVVLGMARSGGSGSTTSAGPAGDAFTMPAVAARSVTYAPLPTVTPAAPTPTGAAPAGPLTSRPPRPRSTSVPVTTRPAPTTSPARTPRTIRPAAPVTHAAPRPTATATATAQHRTTAPTAPRAAAVQRGVALPLHYSTGTATRVITVTAPSRGRTTARLQAWTKAPGGGWLKYGTAVTAHIGAQGMTTRPSESKSATPMGSFTLTQAFGYLADPGTPLPYLRTRPSDWWISQPGRLYNTHQRCSWSCPFNLGDPNEHLYYERPYYGYAVVIDYNTRNAPGGVRQGAGSAFFLHVTDGSATAGCVAIPQSRLVTLMRWLNPRAHPRILIGTS